MTTQPEARVSRAIREALTARGAFVFKIHGGPTMMAGLPDLIACLPGPHGGLFVGVETKMPGGQVSLVQDHVHGKIRAAGGLVIVAHSLNEALSGVWGTNGLS